MNDYDAHEQTLRAAVEITGGQLRMDTPFCPLCRAERVGAVLEHVGPRCWTLLDPKVVEWVRQTTS